MFGVQWTILGLVIVALGVVALLVTYVFAPAASRKSGHYVSGIPITGGVLVAIGFLFTPWKYLSLLGLIEFAVIFIQLAPDVFGILKANKIWAPPSILEGEPVTFTSYKNSYDHEKGKDLPGGGYEVHEIVRYVITKTGSGYNLYALDTASNIVRCDSYPSVEECKEKAVGVARHRWK